MKTLRTAGAALGRWRWTEFQLLIVPAVIALVGMLIVILVPTGTLTFQWRDLWMSFVFIGLLFGVHFFLGFTQRNADQVLLPVVGTITALGLVLIQRLQLSLLNTSPEYAGVAAKQVLWISVGLVLLVATTFVARDLIWLRRYKYTWAILGIGLVALTLVFGSDPNGSGVRLWFNLGLFSFQPSELLKIILVIFLAGYLYDVRDLLSATVRVGPFRLPPLQYLAPMIVMWGVVMLLFVIQKDLGSALLFFGIFLAMIYVATGKGSYVLAGLALFLAGSVVMYKVLDIVQLRVSLWIDPWPQANDRGWQIVSALYAFATGGVLGTGFGFGSPGFVPAVHTDFPFAAIGEELGLAGTLATVALYLILVFRGFHIALRSRDFFHQLLAIGLSTVLGLQTLIILGGATRMIPLTGITMPFISYGGSSLLTNFIVVGLLLRISALSNTAVEHVNVIEAPVPAARPLPTTR